MNERKILFMAVKIVNTEAKVSAPKRTITIKGAIIDKLRFVDDTGDVTDKVFEQIPDDLDTIDVKISLELPEVMDLSEDE